MPVPHLLRGFPSTALRAGGRQVRGDALPDRKHRPAKKRENAPLLAVARKLLHAIYGMFRTLQPFDGTRLSAFRPVKTA
jgi:hypothetical protein